MSDTKFLEVKRAPIIHEFTALAAFAGLLINGDGSGLPFKDGMKLDAFCADNAYTLDRGHFSYDPDETQTHFACCEVTGAQGDCMTFHYVEMCEPDLDRETMINATPNRQVKRFGDWIVARFNNDAKVARIGDKTHAASAYSIKKRFRRWLAAKEAGAV